LKDDPSREWRDKLSEYDGYVALMTNRARSAGIPFVVVALPRHAQAVMIAANISTPGLNLYAFGDQLQRIAAKNGALYLDVLHEFRNVPDVNGAFYPVDQHLTVAGQAMVAEMIAKALTKSPIAALSAAVPQTTTATAVPR
jgi:hypothetical protein